MLQQWIKRLHGIKKGVRELTPDSAVPLSALEHFSSLFWFTHNISSGCFQPQQAVLNRKALSQPQTAGRQQQLEGEHIGAFSCYKAGDYLRTKMKMG